MTSSSAGNASFSQAPRDPNLAACLSIVPGLGQLYNGQSRKGLLFLGVTAVNCFIFLLMAANKYIVSGFINFGLTFHMRPNSDLLAALRELQLGSTLSLIILGLALAFIIYAIRDAYDNALYNQRRQIYPEYALEMPEATSSSYLLHLGLIIFIFILAIFFLKQHRPPAQITDIEFVQNQPPTQKKIKSEKRAEHNSEAAGKHENKPVVAPSPAPKAPSKAAPKVAPHPVAKPMPKPMPTPHPMAKPMPVAKPIPIPIPIPNIFAPHPTPTPTAKPTPSPTPVARPSASPSPSPMPAPTMSHGRGNPSPAPAPKLGTGPVITGAPGPAPVAVNPGNGGGSPSPMPVVAGGDSHSGQSGGGPAPAPAPTRGGGHSGGGASGPMVVQPSIPRSAGGGGEGVRGNPDANSNPGKAPSVAAQADVDFGPYMADLQRRIKRAWFPPKGNESKRVVVVFKVHRGGELSNLRLDHSSGVASADQAALKAVENAAPFRPLPAGSSDDVDIQFTFDYNVFSGGGSGLFRRF